MRKIFSLPVIKKTKPPTEQFNYQEESPVATTTPANQPKYLHQALLYVLANKVSKKI